MCLKELILAARQKDAGAFEALVRKYQAMAVGYGRSLLGDGHLAEDAAQEAFLEAYVRLDALREPGAFPALLRRLVLKHCDRIRRKPRIGGSAIIDVAAERHQGPAQEAEARELARLARRSLARLPEPQRTAVTLYFLRSYRQWEIAEFLGVDEAVIKSRLARARATLKEGWMTMVEHALREGAPGDDFTRRVAEAAEVYTRRGPQADSETSPWKAQRMGETKRILESGEEGRRVDLELSHSTNARLRGAAAVHFGLRRDQRDRESLLRLMRDDNWKVRRGAVQSYAMLIHPDRRTWFHNLHRRAESVPQGIEQLAAMVHDQHYRVRLKALQALRAYVGTEDERVMTALREALGDERHQVRHMAACHLGIVCPGCGSTPEDNWATWED